MLLSDLATELEKAVYRNELSAYDIAFLCRVDVLARACDFAKKIDWRTDERRGELLVKDVFIEKLCVEQMGFGKAALTNLRDTIGSTSLAELASNTEWKLRRLGGISDGSIDLIKKVLKYHNLELRLSKEKDDPSVNREMVVKAISELPERQAKVVRLRYGLEGDKEHSLEEIGITFSVTRERARQIESKARRLLRHKLNLGRMPSMGLIREALKRQ